MWYKYRPKIGMTPLMNNKPKSVVHHKIFNVNILNLVQETLRNKRNTSGARVVGGVHLDTQ